MKKRFISTLLTLAAAFTGSCLALEPVTEDFSAATLDGFRWFQFRAGKGRLQPANGKLNFTVPSKTPTINDFASLELLYNEASTGENWEMIVDFSNIAKMKKHTGCGFMIFNAADRKDYIYVNYYSSYGIDAGVFNNLNLAPAPPLSMRAVVPIGAVRVTYDLMTGLMTFFSSKNSKEEGYIWKTMGTFSPDSTGTADVVSNWGINGDGAFGFQLFGLASLNRVALGQVTIDNFSLQLLP